MNWTVRFHKKSAKDLNKLPKKIHESLVELVNDIIVSGPVRGDWPNYSKLADGSHHCHLNYRSVVVWVVVNNEIRIVEVTYVGSRENAPY